MSDGPAQILDSEKPVEGTAITGCIDAITGDRVYGWAWDPERITARVGIRVEVDGKSVATAIADQPREDLATNGIGDGAHAFEASVPAGIPPEKVTEELTAAGYTLAESHDFLPRQYFLVFKAGA